MDISFASVIRIGIKMKVENIFRSELASVDVFDRDVMLLFIVFSKVEKCVKMGFICYSYRSMFGRRREIST
jgi:hypothetical protein